jgi:anti-sigma regulatory factor (Ser/Thr protein kinase)
MTEYRAFGRSFESLDAIVAFTAEFFARAGIAAGLRPTVDLALEELFTNMVKYGGASGDDIGIAMTAIPDGVEVTLTDRDAPPFDVTRAPEVDVTLPIDRRNPGGLGLHLVRRMLDSIEYDYAENSRQSRITFRKTCAQPPAPGATTGMGGNGARD